MYPCSHRATPLKLQSNEHLLSICLRRLRTHAISLLDFASRRSLLYLPFICHYNQKILRTTYTHRVVKENIKPCNTRRKLHFGLGGKQSKYQ